MSSADVDGVLGAVLSLTNFPARHKPGRVPGTVLADLSCTGPHSARWKAPQLAALPPARAAACCKPHP